MKHWIVQILTLLSLALFSGLTFAHKPSDSYVRLSVHDTGIRGQWDIALRDLDYAIGLDGNDDGKIIWAELRHRHEAIAAYALTRFQIRRGDSDCWSHPTEHLVNHHSDGAYAVVRFSIHCPAAAKTLNLDYKLFFDLDPLHRGLLQVKHGGHTQTAVFSPEQPSVHLDLIIPSPWREFLQFGREGIWHIWIGYDHILFLISLLLPAVLWWGEGRWRGVESCRPAFWEVFKIVTSFTLAHSMTLSLAVFGIVQLPSRWVESVIAASVLLAALHNLYPVMRARLWIVTFAFGLIHGLGFASVLLDLGIPGTSLLLALVGFNLGVEIGQIAIVGMFFPLAFLIRRTWSYQRLVVGFGSIVIAFVASVWLIERSFDLTIGMGSW
jgi:hypothetical protein